MARKKQVTNASSAGERVLGGILPPKISREEFLRRHAQKYADTVLADLRTLKDTIEALDEVLQDEDFDQTQITDYCDQIEQLAIAINEGVTNCPECHGQGMVENVYSNSKWERCCTCDGTGKLSSSVSAEVR